ncbi:MAG: hypothetical protein BWY95_02537 [Bacteroidetes bacterium ADurb.BinA104]|nr:MAG: hypothetical protein BWY95_02537 [Bacteroidetes bacterium ADurb.BinA104]
MVIILPTRYVGFHFCHAGSLARLQKTAAPVLTPTCCNKPIDSETFPPGAIIISSSTPFISIVPTTAPAVRSSVRSVHHAGRCSDAIAAMSMACLFLIDSSSAFNKLSADCAFKTSVCLEIIAAWAVVTALRVSVLPSNKLIAVFNAD